jgi:hypothetical protein
MPRKLRWTGAMVPRTRPFDVRTIESFALDGPASAAAADPAATTTPSSLKQTDFFMATTLCHP